MGRESGGEKVEKFSMKVCECVVEMDVKMILRRKI